MKVTVLGCGASAGVPLVGCGCAVCTSANPRNKRSRVSILIEGGGTKVLVDASPELREQCLRHRITSCDAVIITHNHADHVAGLDDARAFNYHLGTALPMYADRATLDGIMQRMPYIFQPMKQGAGWFKSHFYPKVVAEDNPDFSIGALDFKGFWQGHGRINTLGIRVGDFAYSTDTNHLDDKAFKALEGVKIWLVDCLKRTPAPTHAHLDMTLEWIQKVKPELAILTHMSHDLDYDELVRTLPAGVVPAYDGMVIEVR